MSIVKYTAKNGTQYAYESTAAWNPETQRNEPIRRYLGRVDPETGEILTTSGRRSKKASDATTSSTNDLTNTELSVKLQAVSRDLQSLRDRFTALEQESQNLKSENKRLKAVLKAISKQTAEFGI